MEEKKFNDKYFTIFGFKFNLKYTLIGACVALFALGVLLILDATVTKISWYGVIIGCGFLVALFVAIQLMPFRKLEGDFAYELLWWVFPFSIVGARAFFCIFEKVPLFWEAFKVWNGGLSILGGIMCGALGALICCLIKKVNVVSVFDVIAPCLIIAQAIGRWGNFINQEVYGWEVTNPALQWFPFAVFIDARGGWFLATFFYESILSTIGFFILVILCRKIKKVGVPTCVYLIYYGTIRAILEGLRDDTYILKDNNNMPASRITSIIFLAIGVIGLTYIIIKSVVDKKKNKYSEPNMSEEKK